ncbi:PQ loop repeat-domain-containing protein [Choanephora cucurbitarum]|nr:PQ loop repeat-domain-containing protein [Choanephora cucurbitarum]
MTVCIPTQDGIPYIQWINYIFGDCVYTSQEAISLLLGYCSMFFWLNAQLPQLVENYKKGSAECLSLNFLCIWLAGDTANLIGSLLTHQLPFQIYLGIYFVSIDICLLVQWTYYNKLKKTKQDYIIIPSHQENTKKEDHLLFQHPAHTPVNIHSSSHIVIDELTPFSSSASPSKWYTLSPSSNNPSSRKLMALMLFAMNLVSPSTSLFTTMDSSLSIQADDQSIVWIGRFFAWTCTTLYLMSRIPQLLKNYRRQSVEGLSASLFIFAVFGNLTYASSILSHPGQTVDTLLEALPYLIGSAGTLMFDFSIFCQFLYYRNRNEPDNKQLLV